MPLCLVLNISHSTLAQPQSVKKRDSDTNNYYNIINFEYNEEKAIQKANSKFDQVYKQAQQTPPEASQYALSKAADGKLMALFHSRRYEAVLDTWEFIQKNKIKASIVYPVRAYYATAQLHLQNKDYSKALLWIEKANRLYKTAPYAEVYDAEKEKYTDEKANPFEEYYNNGYHMYALREWIRKRQKLGRIQPAYVIKAMNYIFTNTDVKSPKGNNGLVNWKYESRDFQAIYIQNILATLAIEAMTDGKLSIEWQSIRINDRVYYGKDDFKNPLNPFNNQSYKKGIQDHKDVDLTVMWIDSNEQGASGLGGGSHIQMLHRPDYPASWTTLVHEFFHCIESHVGLKAHIWWKPETVPYKDWSRKSGDEMSYYEMHFRSGKIREKLNQAQKEGASNPWQKVFSWHRGYGTQARSQIEWIE